MTRAPGYPPVEQTVSYERGTYNTFDPNHWRKVPKEMHLDYSKLEERPQLPPQLQPGGGGAGGAVATAVSAASGVSGAPGGGGGGNQGGPPNLGPGHSQNS